MANSTGSAPTRAVLEDLSGLHAGDILQSTTFWACCLALLATLYTSFSSSRKASAYPTINESKSWFNKEGKLEYTSNARKLLIDGYKKFKGPFNLNTDLAPVLMLPAEYIDAVNAEPNLSFQAYTMETNLAKYETFRTFRAPPPGMFEEAVLKGLTRSLPKFTKPLSRETMSCLDDTWGQSKEWHEVDLKDDVLKWVTRLSSCIFLGERFTSNAEWLRITEGFTMDLFMSVAITRFFPSFLHWPVERLLPLNCKVRSDYRQAAAILEPVLAERRKEIAAAEREGRKPDLPDDSIEWFRTAARGVPYNDVDVQLGLAVAAIHTTSDLLIQAMLNLCAHPEVIEPMRKEMVDVLGKHGWHKVALTELRLLDSFFKETQRLKPIAMASMHRSATKDVSLTGGIKINKGEHVAISSHQMWDAAEYDDPDTFDPYRYVKRREVPGLENKSLLVSTTPNHLGFAHGKHACPGRFFAANEVKIAMVHILLNYDLELVDKEHVKWSTYGVAMMTNPKAKLRVKRRVPEIRLEDE